MNAQNEAAAIRRNIIKKITVKTVLGGKVSLEKLIDHNKKSPGTALHLMNVVGRASDFTAGNGDNGPYVKLLGQFKATNVETGEVFVSGACILPGAANDMVYGALKGLGDGGGTIDFAFRVGVVRDDTAATGYVYKVEQVMQPSAADPLAALEQQAFPQLAAPAQPEPEKETAGKRRSA